jgi:HAD superfamily hydrolase (TIGR01509 family)
LKPRDGGVRWADGRLFLVSGSGCEVGPIEGLIFDLGGTLDADGTPWGERFRTMLEDAGLPGGEPGAVKPALEAGEQAVLRHPGAATLGLSEMVQLHVSAQLECLGAAESELADRLRDRFVTETARTLAGRRGLLERLADRMPLAVVSNGCGNTERLLAEAGLESFFRAIVDSSQVGFWKPDPRILEPALARLGLPRERVAVVGDRADRDVEAALAGGLRAVWVLGDGPLSLDDERLRGVHAVLRSVDELDPKAEP